MDRELRFLSKKQVTAKTSLSAAEIDRREQRKEFPTRRRLSKYPRGRVVWWEHEVDDWMLAQSGGYDPRDTSRDDAAPTLR